MYGNEAVRFDFRSVAEYHISSLLGMHFRIFILVTLIVSHLVNNVYSHVASRPNVASAPNNLPLPCLSGYRYNFATRRCHLVW